MAKSLKQLNDHDLLVAAFTAAQTNQHPLAIKHFKEALRRDPRDPFAYMEMAKCYYYIDDLAHAHQCLEKAFTFARSDASLWMPLANACQAVRDYSSALRALKKAEYVPELRTTAITRQAEVHELSNQIDAAEAAISRLPDVPPTQALLAIQAKLHRRRGELPKAREILEKLIEGIGASNKDFKASIQYELATILDKLKEYDLAFKTLNEAKSHHRGSDSHRIAERGRRGVIGTLDGLCANSTASALRDWADQTSAVGENHRHCFLLGHPRSGTTLIEQTLDAHPNVTAADETPIFHNTIWMPGILQNTKNKSSSYADFLSSLPPNYVRRLRKDYRIHWQRAVGNCKDKPSVWLDKNPALTTRLAIIARFFPEAPIVFALRDPRDVILSSFMQPVGLNDWSINWLTLEDTVDYYCFAMQMWLDIRDKLTNPWIEVRYEDCVNDLEHEARRTTEHLGLQWDPCQIDVQGHVSKKVVYSPTYGDVAQPVYSSSVNRWANYGAHLDPFESKLAPYIKAFGYS